jgi:hypothetical protein
MLRLVQWIALTMFSVIGISATFLPLALDAQGERLWGLQWQYWLMIGLAIVFLSFSLVLMDIFRKYLAITSEEARQRREISQKGIEVLELLVDELAHMKEVRERPLR